jgi:hypothetical protein
LVQLGDLVDRGPKSRAVLDYFMTLQTDAQRKGGSVRVSLGNHEMMNIHGDMRYVVAADYEAFTDNRSEQRRQNAFRDYARLETRKGRMAVEEVWMKSHPLGFIEHREAFAPQGKYGKWLRSQPAIHKIGTSAFLHGGINPALNARSIDQLNTSVRTEIQAFDQITKYLVDKQLALPFFTLEEWVQVANEELAKTNSIAIVDQTPEVRNHAQLMDNLSKITNWMTVHDDGPLWFRGYDRWSDAEGAPLIARLTQTLGVDRFVVAHTPQPTGEIRSRFGGKVFLIDTAMLLGRASALEISGNRVRALYPNRQVDFN